MYFYKILARILKFKLTQFCSRTILRWRFALPIKIYTARPVYLHVFPRKRPAVKVNLPDLSRYNVIG